MRNEDLPVIQRAVDLIKWYIPFLERLPAGHRHVLGYRVHYAAPRPLRRPGLKHRGYCIETG